MHWWLWLTPLRIGLALLALAGAFGAGDQLARRELNAQAARAAAEAHVDRADLAARLAALEVQRDLARNAVGALEAEIASLDDENGALLRENLMLRNLVSGTEPDAALQIARFELRRPARAEALRYRLLLTWTGDERTGANGDVTIDLLGQRDGERVTLPLSEIARVSTYPLPFTIHTFQGFTGEIRLPDDFEPSAVRVRAALDGDGADLQQEYPWEVGLL